MDLKYFSSGYIKVSLFFSETISVSTVVDESVKGNFSEEFLQDKSTVSSNREVINLII
jgi:hypothetical protein